MPTVETTTISELRGRLAEAVRSLDLARITGAAATELVAQFAELERLAASGRLLAAGRAAETHAWSGAGDRSAPGWLARQTGTSVGEAAAALDTAKKIGQLPATGQALRAGLLSAQQAKMVADAASADPTAETGLLETAQSETFQGLKHRARRVQAAATDSATRQKRIRAQRSLRSYTDHEGAWCLTMRGPAEDGIRFEAMMKPAQEQAFQQKRKAGAKDSFENRAYDAFVDQWKAREPAPVTGAGKGNTVPGPSTAPAVPGGANTKVIIVADHAAIVRGHAVAGEACEVPGLGPVPVSAVHVAMEDAFLAVAIRKGRDVVSVAHHGRGLNAHQRTAIEAAGLKCSNIACNQTVAIQIDHRTPWAQSPITELRNQDPLCPEDHRRKTHHGWSLVPGNGRRRFVPPP